MKLKNVKKGTRVALKQDVDHLQKGMTGTISEDSTIAPFISWDNWYCGNNLDSIQDKSVWAVPFVYLKRIKE